MRDHNYQLRMKNCHVRFTLTVENEKSLREEKKSPFEIIDWFFLSRRDITSQWSGQYKIWTADYGLRTGYKTWTGYKMRTKHYGLGINYGLRYKTRTEHYGLSIKHEERF